MGKKGKNSGIAQAGRSSRVKLCPGPRQRRKRERKGPKKPGKRRISPKKMGSGGAGGKGNPLEREGGPGIAGKRPQNGPKRPQKRQKKQLGREEKGEKVGENGKKWGKSWEKSPEGGGGGGGGNYLRGSAPKSGGLAPKIPDLLPDREGLVQNREVWIQNVGV